MRRARGLSLALVAVVVLLAVGCASNKSEAPVPLPGGGFLRNDDGSYVMATRDYTDESVFHAEQAALKRAALANRKPLLEIIARPGEDISFTGVEAIRVYAESDTEALVQYQSQWADAAKDNVGFLSIAAMGWKLLEGSSYGNQGGPERFRLSDLGNPSGQGGSALVWGDGNTITMSPAANPVSTITGGD